MLDKCDAYLIAKTPHQINGLVKLAEKAGFARCIDVNGVGCGGGAAACIRFFVLHYKLEDSEMVAAMSAVRSSIDNDLKFSPFVLIIDDCAFETILKYVDMGFDDIISLPEKADIVRHRLVSLIGSEHVYVESDTYFGPDRRRMEAPGTSDPRRAGGKHFRHNFRRLPGVGVKVIHRILSDGHSKGPELHRIV